MDFLTALKAALGDSNVFTAPDRLEQVSRDETHGLAPSLPDVLVQPKNHDEVVAIVKLCAKHNIPLTPRGGGTGKSGGAVPVRGGLVMGFERMNHILETDPKNLTARVEPGVILGDLQEQVDTLGLYYPPDPASLKWCTLGGNVAENAAGPSTLKYGTTRDYVLALQAVLANGDVVRTGKQTIKGVTGYDLTALLCGSEGTLAVITEITLKLLPKPQSTQTALLMFSTAQHASEAVTQILSGGILPRCIEFLDKISIEALRRLKTAPYTFATNIEAALIIETDGDDPESVLAILSRAASLAQATQTVVAQNEKQRRDIWQTRHLLSEATKKLHKHKVSEDIVVPRTRIPEMLSALYAFGEKYGLATCAFGHAGDGNLHAQIMFDDARDQPKVDALLEELFRLTIQMGGTLTGEHGIGVAKMRYLPLEQSAELIELQKRIKHAFDPNGILNPGKILL